MYKNEYCTVPGITVPYCTRYPVNPVPVTVNDGVGYNLGAPLSQAHKAPRSTYTTPLHVPPLFWKTCLWSIEVTSYKIRFDQWKKEKIMDEN